jgi:hypothetical protein
MAKHRSYSIEFERQVAQEYREGIANSEKEKAREEDCTAACGRCRSIRDERRRSTDDRSGSERIRRF